MVEGAEGRRERGDGKGWENGKGREGEEREREAG